MAVLLVLGAKPKGQASLSAPSSITTSAARASGMTRWVTE